MDRDRSPIEDERDDRRRFRSRSRSPVDSRRGAPPLPYDEENDTTASNPGNNLFVTGISPRCKDEELLQLFEKFGSVEKCNIMRDPHTRDSRGFAFVNFSEVSHADNARESLSGTEFLGKVLNIDRAKRGGARKATPGHYYGPPKKNFDRRDFRDTRGGDRGFDRGYDRPYERNDRIDRGYPDRGGYPERGGAFPDRYNDRYNDRGGYPDRGGYERPVGPDRGAFRGGPPERGGERPPYRGDPGAERRPPPRFDPRDSYAAGGRPRSPTY